MEGTEKTVNVENIVAEVREQVFREEAGKIDIEEIMNEIREQAARIPAEDLPQFSDMRTGDETAEPADGKFGNDGGIHEQFSKEIRYLKDHSQVPYYWDLGRGIKGFLRRVIRKLGKCIGVPMNEKQNDFNLHAVSGIDASRILSEYQQDLILEQRNTISALRQEIQSLTGSIEELQQRVSDDRKDLAAQSARMDLLEEQIHDNRRDINAAQQMETRLNNIDKAVDDISTSVARTIRYYLDHPDETGRNSDPVETRDKEQPPEEITVPAETGNDPYTAIDYFKFQNDFRGTQSQILERQRIYLPYFRDKKGRVFDLGCGRGEFLRLMKEEKIPAYGADTYAEYEITGKMYGIDIRIGDGIAMLAEEKDPLGGIFCAQVIEHLDFGTLQRLCVLAHEKLEEGAWLVMETPNPMCVSAMTNAFYLDPSHTKPVHPLLMEYMLKAIGFRDVQLIWPDHSLPQIPKIESDSIANLAEVNQALERVSGLLFGSQDYAVAARK